MNFDPLRFSLEQTEKNDPLLILSQDYELFFQKSGTVEQCLIKPTDMLLSFAKKNGIVITFFIDAGMLVSMRRLARTVPTISKELSRLKKHANCKQSSWLFGFSCLPSVSDYITDISTHLSAITINLAAMSFNNLAARSFKNLAAISIHLAAMRTPQLTM